MLKRLQGAGLVVRQRSARDERRVEVGLTAQGRALRQQVDDVPLRIARATGLGTAELVALRDTLTRVTDTIHRQKEL
ncbi:hypothetical protein GCM10027614_25970 [Micromonospora vulcania]